MFDEYEKTIPKTSIEEIDSSPNLTEDNKIDRIRELQINIFNQYYFINIAQILTKSIQKFEQYNITSEKATHCEGQCKHPHISELQSCFFSFGMLLGYASLHLSRHQH